MGLMVQNEWRGVTVEKICAAAGLNKRYFYESFTDIDGLSAAVVDDIADEVRSVTVAAAVVRRLPPIGAIGR